MSNPEENNREYQKMREKLKAELLKQLKNEIKQELLTEIYQELKEEGTTKEIQRSELKREGKPKDTKQLEIIEQINPPKEKIQITVKAFLKIASHAKKYANDKIPKSRWVEVIGLLAGKFKNEDQEGILVIEDAYPMGHGNAVYAEIKDYKNFARAFHDLKKKGLFICGWYHSHPSYGLFLSSEDMGTQARYQKLWEKSLALVIDPYQIDGSSYGFSIFRANLETKKWSKIPFSFSSKIETKVLPDLLEFIDPLIDGKPLYLEYDTFNG
ncbi:hypothetical protein [Candidatus Harpocratesius sp.]